MSKVTIDSEVLTSLIYDSLYLAELEGAGVDNWEGYDMAERPTDDSVEEEFKRLTSES